MTRLLLCAGERSGDLLAAELARALAARVDGVEIRGLVGPAMREAGVGAVAKMEDVTAIGVIEAVRIAPKVKEILGLLEATLDRWRPDLVVTVDSPSSLLRLCRAARARRIPTVHWVSPQVWAWRPGRVHTVAESVDTLLCLFPHEPALYASTGLRAVFTGHPAVARVRRRDTRVGGSPVFGLGPGSRSAEITALWPTFRNVATELRRRYPQAGFAVPVAPGVDRRALAGVDAVFFDDIASAGSAADVFLVASGTATLELAALGTPMVVAYRVHPVTWAVGRRLVTGVRFLALPNVLEDAEIVPEHLQDLDPRAIADDLCDLVGPGGDRQRRDLARVVGRLEGSDAVERAVEEVVRLL